MKHFRVGQHVKNTNRFQIIKSVDEIALKLIPNNKWIQWDLQFGLVDYIDYKQFQSIKADFWMYVNMQRRTWVEIEYHYSRNMQFIGVTFEKTIKEIPKLIEFCYENDHYPENISNGNGALNIDQLIIMQKSAMGAPDKLTIERLK